jgi:Ca2+:H+ antiporter
VLFFTYFCALGFRPNAQAFFPKRQSEVEDTGEHWSRGKAVIILRCDRVRSFALRVSGGHHRERATTLGLTEVFVGVIVVAIIGNAAEHSTAILMALKTKWI